VLDVNVDAELPHADTTMNKAASAASLVGVFIIPPPGGISVLAPPEPGVNTLPGPAIDDIAEPRSLLEVCANCTLSAAR
jgi:hypothetical protein